MTAPRDRDAAHAVAAVRRSELERQARLRREGRKASPDDFAAATAALRRVDRDAGVDDAAAEIVAKLDLGR